MQPWSLNLHLNLSRSRNLTVFRLGLKLITCLHSTQLSASLAGKHFLQIVPEYSWQSTGSINISKHTGQDLLTLSRLSDNNSNCLKLIFGLNGYINELISSELSKIFILNYSIVHVCLYQNYECRA